MIELGEGMLVVMNGYHGTSKENATVILQTKKWKITKDKNYLGDGVYFMEGSKKWACIWAKKGKHHYVDAYVLEAEIRVENETIFNLAYDKWYFLFKLARKKLEEEFQDFHVGDGAAINLACEMLEKGKFKGVKPLIVKVVKAFIPFNDGENSKHKGKIPSQQIQIAVREKGLDAIKLKEEMLPCSRTS